MDFEKDHSQLSERYNRSIVEHLNSFSMSCGSRAHFTVRGIFGASSHVPGPGFKNSRCMLESVFKSPETTTGKEDRPYSTGRDEIHGNGVHAVPRISFGEAFSCKQMPQMTAAGSAEYLSSVTILVRSGFNSALYGKIKGGPAAMGAEFRF